MAKKPAKTEVPAFNPTTASLLHKEDLLPMQLAWKELENSNLKLQMAQVQVEKAAQALEAARVTANEMNILINKKYALDVQSDRINIETGEISRAK